MLTRALDDRQRLEDEGPSNDDGQSEVDFNGAKPAAITSHSAPLFPSTSNIPGSSLDAARATARPPAKPTRPPQSGNSDWSDDDEDRKASSFPPIATSRDLWTRQEVETVVQEKAKRQEKEQLMQAQKAAADIGQGEWKGPGNRPAGRVESPTPRLQKKSSDRQ